MATRALRERRDDIPLLAQYLIERYARQAGKKIRSISKRTLDVFMTYEWAGNVRVLQNVIERAVILCEGETFGVDESWLRREAGAVPVPEPTASLTSTLAVLEREIIEGALAASRGRISGLSGAAARLGIPRQTLESKIRAPQDRQASREAGVISARDAERRASDDFSASLAGDVQRDRTARRA